MEIKRLADPHDIYAELERKLSHPSRLNKLKGYF